MRSAFILATLAAAAALPLTANATVYITASAVPFVDISTTGTSIIPPGALGDDVEHPITAAQLAAAGFTGNALLAGGVGITVGNNGGIIWNPVAVANGTSSTGDQVGYVNRTDFLTMAAANGGDTGNGNGLRQFLAVLWDDNFPSTTAGALASIRWQVIAGDLIVEWQNQDHFNAQGAGQVTYEAIIRGTVAPGGSFVDFVYQDTLYNTNQYQDDGGSATIGYKNWGVNAMGNDVEYGQGGGNNTISDPAFGDATMRPKVSGYGASNNPGFTHSVSIIPTPGSLALVGFGGLIVARRRRA